MGDKRAEEVLKLYDSLVAERQPHEGFWHRARYFVIRNRRDAVECCPVKWLDRLYDSTAVEANNKLAGAQVTFLCPPTSPWLRFMAGNGVKDVAGVEEWFEGCTRVVHEELSRSNFYSEVHEAFRDRGGAGVMMLEARETEERGEKRLVFDWTQVGHFVAAHGNDKMVTVCGKELRMSAVQMRDQFGEEVLGGTARARLGNPAEMYKEDLRVVYFCRSRRVRDAEVLGPKGMPWEEWWIGRDDAVVLREGGQMEQPFIVCRFMEGADVYGYSPFETCEEEVLKLQRLTKNMDKLADLAVNPRVLELANQIADVDFRAGGRTFINPAVAGSERFPREWATNGGEFSIGNARILQYQDFVRRAFFVNLIEPIAAAQNGKEKMTATEVMAREHERMLTFSPALTQFVSDFHVMARRIFMLCYRMGKFPVPPEGVVRRDARGVEVIADPVITYTNKASMILSREESDALMEMYQLAGQMAQVQPEVLDCVDGDVVLRAVARDRGTLEGLRDDRVVAQMREERMEMQRMQAEAQLLKDGGAGAAQVGRAVNELQGGGV